VFTHAPPVTSSMAADVMATSDCEASASPPNSILRDSMAPPLTQHDDHLFLSSFVAAAALDLTDEGQFTEDGKVTAAAGTRALTTVRTRAGLGVRRHWRAWGSRRRLYRCLGGGPATATRGT
jgi:hypothetical protein